jgi:uncharacterized damage-inducible protein DinB
MNEIDRICRQMKQMFEGDAWHGPALMEILECVDVAGASARPIAGGHSIWEIVLHLTGTQKLQLRRLGGNSEPLTAGEDWPPVPEVSEQAWRETLALLRSQEEELRTAVEGFPIDQLDEPLIAGGSSAYNNFHGHIQHTLYHAAQIRLLRRAAAA